MRTKTRQMLSLGNKIKQARERAGFTQDQLAERVGISRAAIARYESGEIEPRLKNLIAIAESLNVSTDHLLGVNVSESTPAQLSKEAEEALDTLIRELTMFQKKITKERNNQS